MTTYVAVVNDPRRLYHHGVKGQQWGVRNGPPYPIEDKVLKKGSVIRSVSANVIDPEQKLKSNRWIYTYNPKDSWDSKVYTGPFSTYTAMVKGAYFIAEHEYKTTKDLKMPTRKERIDVFKDVYDDKKYNKKMVRELSGIQKRLKAHEIGSDKARNVNLKKLTTDDDYEAAYEVFNHAMEAMYRFKSTSEYAKRISEKYDAMVDDNNVNIYNNVHDPVIIFKTENLISTTGNMPVRMLTNYDITENTNYVRDELAKQGKNLLL